MQFGDNNHQINHIHLEGDAARRARMAVTGAVESPYQGLESFRQQDAPYFFGRKAAVDEIYRRLAEQADGPALLIISGVSGAGKSSLLQAGVLSTHNLARLTTPGGKSWPYVVLTPDRAPLRELAVQVSGQLPGTDGATLHQALRADPSDFALTAYEAAGRRGRLLLVVDQFEQVFTQCDDEAERHAFIKALHAAATVGHGPRQVPAAAVILVVRADFEARCAEYAGLLDAVQNHYFLPPMTETQLRASITEPARKAGSSVDEALTAHLVQAIGAAQVGPGILPHLSHALDQAWRNRTGDTLTLEDYDDTGGLEGSIAASADQAYKALTPSQQKAARPLFLRLVATTPGGTNTADQANRSDLTNGKTAQEATDIEAVLEAFANKRLLTISAETVQLAHEALLTAWPLLHDTWLAENRADQIIRTQLRTAAANWATHNHDPAYLHRRSQLQSAEAMAARTLSLTQAEQEFLHASTRDRRRAARLRRATVAALTALTLTASVIATVAIRDSRIANQQHAIALSRQLATEALSLNATEPLTARQLALAAWAVSPTPQDASALAALLADQQQAGELLASDPTTTTDAGNVSAVAFAPSGKLLATGSDNGMAQLWNPATEQRIGQAIPADPGGSVNALAFSPNGQLLATAGSDGTAKLWNPATGQPIGHPILADPGSTGDRNVGAVAFSPNGRLLATSEDDGTVRLWNPATGEPIATAPSSDEGIDGLQTVAFSPNGQLLATSEDDGSTRLWNPATGQLIGPPIPAVPSNNGFGYVQAVAFSPNGQLLAIANSDGTIRLWSTATHQIIGQPIPANPGGSANAVAFSPNGQLLAIANSDGTIRLWSTATYQFFGAPINIASSLTGAKPEFTFSRSTNLFATFTFGDAVFVIWDARTRKMLRPPINVGYPITSLAFSSGGSLLATGGVPGNVLLFSSVAGTARPRPAAIPYKIGYSMAFNPKGDFLAVDSLGRIALYSISLRRTVSTGNLDNLFPQLTFSPAGEDLVAIAPGKAVLAWRLTGSRLISTSVVSDGTRATTAAFSPDGRILALGQADGSVQLWNPATATKVSTLLPADPGTVGVTAITFSPDGRFLAISYKNDEAQLRSAITGSALGGPLPSAVTDSRQMAFTSDSQFLATAGSNNTVQFWPLSQYTDPYATLCADAGPPSSATWKQYAPNEPMPKIC